MYRQPPDYGRFYYPLLSSMFAEKSSGRTGDFPVPPFDRVFREGRRETTYKTYKKMVGFAWTFFAKGARNEFKVLLPAFSFKKKYGGGAPAP